MERYINLNIKRLKQGRKPVFTRRSVIDMPKTNLSVSDLIIKKQLPKRNRKIYQNQSQFHHRKVDTWLSLRILDFLNQAESVRDLTDVQENGNNYSIGETVARRILDKKAQLPRKQFTKLEELEEVSGFGDDKLNDLILLLHQRADAYFKKSLFEDLLLSNWEIRSHRVELKKEEEWAKMMQSAVWRQLWLTEQIGNLSEQLMGKENGAKTRDYMRSAYIDSLSEEEIASYAFALCWYRVDMDNWFSFDRMLSKIRSYLTYYQHPSYTLQLLLVKGFPMQQLNAQGISTPDLPIILNFAEQSVTFWVIDLKD